MRQVTDPTVEQGRVIDTDPAAGEEAHEGDTVILRVSSGPGDVAVPNVVDQSQSDATAALRAEEFAVKVEESASDTVDEGASSARAPRRTRRPRRAARSRSSCPPAPSR